MDKAELLIGLPAHDGRVVALSVVELVHVGRLLHRPVRYFVAQAGNIPKARNHVMDAVRGYLDRAEGTAWVLWMDSDILIGGQAAAIAAAVQHSEETGQAWAADYRMADGGHSLVKEAIAYGGEHYTAEELAALAEWAPIGLAGFGLCYLPMCLRYVFHADTLGEDVHFYLEHPTLRPGYAKSIHVGHQKLVTLM